MPFLLDGNPTGSEISEAVNYLLSNFTANISSDPNNGQITGSGGQIIGYLYKYMMVKYADSFDGTVNFSNSQTNRLYYGLRNDNSSTESTNPADYIWYKVDGGFGTTKTLYYKVTGGRSIEFNVGTTSPGYAWVPDTGVAIDLDALTMAFTVNAIIYKWGTSTAPARPTSTTTYNWITSSYTAPSGWSTSIPSGGTFGSYLWSITILITQTGGIESTVLDWTNVAYPIVAVGINGQNGTNGLVAYLAQDQASPTPAFTSTTTGPNAPSGWSLVAPSVSVGQVLWYLQGQYNSSTTDTVNGVPPNTTVWTGPIAASIFQDIRSDNWNGSNPPTPGNPATYGTQGYYIQRNTGAVYLNSVFARNYIEVGGSAADVNANTTTISGSKITANSVTATQMQTGTITAASGIIANAAITNANIGTAEVSTLSIAGNAVTVPSFTYLPSITTYTSTSQTILSLTTDTGGQPIVLFYQFSASLVYAGAIATIYFYVNIAGNSYLIDYDTSDSSAVVPISQSGLIYLANPPTGSFTCSMTYQASSAGTNVTVMGNSTGSYTNIYTLGTKR